MRTIVSRTALKVQHTSTAENEPRNE